MAGVWFDELEVGQLFDHAIRRAFPHQQRQSSGHNDMAGYRKEVREHAEQVGHQNEDEQREYEREEFHPLRSRTASQQVRYKFIANF